MNYVVKRFRDLSRIEIQQYIALFNSTFNQKITEEEFNEKFTQRMGEETVFAFLVSDQDGIVGSVAAIEVPYVCRNRHYRLALTVDGMIAPTHRKDWLALKRQHDLLIKELQQRGVVYVFTKPNDKSYLYLKKIIGFADVGELSVYGFPLQVSRLIRYRMAWLDHIWSLMIAALAWGFGPASRFRPGSIDKIEGFTAGAVDSAIYRVRDSEFLRTRYANERYKCATRNGDAAVYTIREHSGIIACFVLEESGMSFGGWWRFIQFVATQHPESALILRVIGKQQVPWPLIRVPRWLLPDKFHVIGKAICDDGVPADALLRVDLSDFEVI